MIAGSAPAGAGTPLTEMATSPIPNAYIIMNCPGAGAGNAGPTGVSRSVDESRVSQMRLSTR